VLTRECPRPALLIGDSASDRSAAQAAGIDFMLRRTPLNGELQRACDCPQFDDFRDV
jgi:phosphoglycolate phosphatase-like HAD superfamily hydrolase